MFREIRRRDRALSELEARDILARADHGALATIGADGWPYSVPLNHVLTGDLLYMHSALEGHKLENIANEERVSFCAVASASVIPEKLSMLYESAVIFGRASLVSDVAEKRRALELLAQRFYTDFPDEAAETIRKDGPRTVIIRVHIERITGKAHV